MGVFDINNSVQDLDKVNEGLSMRDSLFRCTKRMYYEGIENHIKFSKDPFSRTILDCTGSGYWSDMQLEYDFDFFSKLHRIDIDCIQLSIYTKNPIHWRSFPFINGRVMNMSLYVPYALSLTISKDERLLDIYEQMMLPKITSNIRHIGVFVDHDS